MNQRRSLFIYHYYYDSLISFGSICDARMKENEKRWQIEPSKCIDRADLGCKSLGNNMPNENGEMWKEKCFRVNWYIDLDADAFEWSRMRKEERSCFFSLDFLSLHTCHTHGQDPELSCFSSTIRRLYPIHVVATHSSLIFTWKLLFTLFEIRSAHKTHVSFLVQLGAKENEIIAA